MQRATCRGVVVLAISVAVGLPGCRDFHAGDGRQQDHAMLNLKRKKAAFPSEELGSLGDGALSSRTLNADLIVKSNDKGPGTPQQITLTEADSVPAMASWAGMTVDEFVSRNPSLRNRSLVPGDAVTLDLTKGELARFNGMRKTAIARRQVQKASAQEQVVRVDQHVMQPGQDLTYLVRTYPTNEDLLMRENGATRMGALRPGLTIKVPILATAPPALR